MLTVSKYNLIESRWSGQLGIAMAVYNKENSHILVGKRSPENPYRPYYYSLIGGIIQKHDLDGSIIDCCMRELNEEIDITFDQPRMELIGIIPNLEKVGKQLIINVYTDLDLIENIKTNEEWMNGSLKWYSINKIQQLEKKKMLNDLKFKIQTIMK